MPASATTRGACSTFRHCQAVTWRRFPPCTAPRVPRSSHGQGWAAGADACAVWQGRILAAPRTFRDEPTAAEEALFDEAAAACAELLAEHQRRKAVGLLLKAPGPGAPL